MIALFYTSVIAALLYSAFSSVFSKDSSYNTPTWGDFIDGCVRVYADTGGVICATALLMGWLWQ